MASHLVLLLCSSIPVILALTDSRFVRNTRDDTKDRDKDTVSLKTYQMDCVEETNVDPDLVIRFKAGDWRDQYTLKKWVLCVLVKMGLMSPEGVYHFDEAMNKLEGRDKYSAEKLIDECLSKTEIPAVDIAWRYIQCVRSRDPLGNFSSISVLSP